MLEVSKVGGVARVTLNRPELRNAFDDELIKKLRNAFAEIEEDSSVRVMVLAGNGPAFCAGADLNWMKRIISVRRTHRAFGRGTLEFLHPGNRKVIAYLREYEDESILCVANLSRSAQPVELDLARFRGRVPVELLGNSSFPPLGDLPYFLTLPGHGFYWFELSKPTEPTPDDHEDWESATALLNQIVEKHADHPTGGFTALHGWGAIASSWVTFSGSMTPSSNMSA